MVPPAVYSRTYNEYSESPLVNASDFRPNDSADHQWLQ